MILVIPKVREVRFVQFPCCMVIIGFFSGTARRFPPSYHSFSDLDPGVMVLAASQQENKHFGSLQKCCYLTRSYSFGNDFSFKRGRGRCVDFMHNIVQLKSTKIRKMRLISCYTVLNGTKGKFCCRFSLLAAEATTIQLFKQPKTSRQQTGDNPVDERSWWTLAPSPLASCGIEALVGLRSFPLVGSSG